MRFRHLLTLLTALLLVIPAAATAQTSGFTTERQVDDRDLDRPSLVTGVDVERSNAADRVIFTFDGPLPGYEIGFVDEVVHAGSADTGEGEPVDVAGDATVEVVLSPATATGEGGLAIPPHQQAQRPRLPALDEVVFAGEFDDATTFALGVSDRTALRVETAPDSAELTVEIAHPDSASADGSATPEADADASATTEPGTDETSGQASAEALAALPDFDDIAASAHRENIRLIAGEGVTEGCDAGRYCPTDNVDRAQMASFLARALDLPATDEDHFDDDDGLFHEDNINRVAAAGITQGCDADRYCPTSNVDRDQMASFITRGFDVGDADLDHFIDDEGNTHESAINAAASAGVTNGCNTWSSRFCPGSDVTRGQMASFLARAMDLTDPVRLLLEAGDEGDDVEQLQRRLADLDYFVGPIDGIYGDLTEQAVTAFQKLHELSRDGIVGPNVRERLANPRPFYPQTSSGTWMELDETRQILVRVVNGNVREIFNTSSGTEEPYTYNGQQYLGDTPNGRHEIFRQIDGWRTSHLGRLYRPKYFTTGGHAIHGSTNVPPYPASHGCVRVSIAAMDHLWNANRLPIGSGVWVYNPYTP